MSSNAEGRKHRRDDSRTPIDFTLRRFVSLTSRLRRFVGFPPLRSGRVAQSELHEPRHGLLRKLRFPIPDGLEDPYMVGYGISCEGLMALLEQCGASDGGADAARQRFQKWVGARAQ